MAKSKYIKKILPNGMTVLMAPMRNMHTVMLGIFVKAGSRNETDETSGIAHFLEHMLFKGTTNRTHTQLFKELDRLGTVYNAATTTQTTYYYIHGNANNTKQLIDIILDLYMNPIFDSREITKEKKVIIEEMRMRADHPGMKLYSAMHKKIFVGTSLARDIIGTEETVSSFKRKDFINFRDSLYTPDNTVFVIAGGFNPVPIYRMIEKVLKPLKNSFIVPVTYYDEKAILMKNMIEQSEPYVHIKRNTRLKQAYMFLVFPLYDLNKTKFHEIELLVLLLTSGFSSRLNNALRENKGLTYGSHSYAISYSDVGIFAIDIVINPIELVNGIKIILSELRRIKSTLITSDEMTKIVRILINDDLEPPGLMNLITLFGFNLLADRNFELNTKKNITEIRKIRRVDIQKLAREIFVRNKINLFLYGNIIESDFNFMTL